MQIPTIVASLSILLAATTPAWTAPSDQIEVLFRNKPPYHYIEGGKPAGFLYDCVQKLFDDAGIATHFDEAPVKRILQAVQENQRPICSFGWYKLDERAAYARFSRPIYQDRPQVLVSTRDVARQLAARGSLARIMTDSSFTLGLITGLSYGAQLDRMIEHFPGELDRATIEPLALAAKVASGHIQFTFLDQDDFDYLQSLSQDTLDRDFPGQADALKSLVGVSLPDMPPGLFRHILCDRQVPATIVAKLDRIIAKHACTF